MMIRSLKIKMKLVHQKQVKRKGWMSFTQRNQLRKKF